MNNVIVIEGNIGTGKSTLLPKLAAELTAQTEQPWTYILEDVDSNPDFQKHLEAFTADTIANRVAFQNFMTDMRHAIGKGLPKGVNVVLERSLLSDLLFSFANHQCDAEDDSHIQRIYEALNDYTRIDTCIYFKAYPRVSYSRMLQRGREQEQGTSYEYIESISQYHDSVLPTVCNDYDIPMLTINYNVFLPTATIAKQVLSSIGHCTTSKTKAA